jgi:hypothetical protein
MDNKSITTYTDKESFEKIFNDYYAKFQPFLKTKESGIRIEFINYSEGNAAFKIKDQKDLAENCIIYTRNDNTNDSIFSLLKFLKKEERDVYVFSPVKIQIVSTPREEERKILNPKNNPAERLFIINMISEFIIINNLEHDKKKISQIENIIKIKLDKTFQHIRFYFIHQGKDPRMECFKNNIAPIFIPDKDREPDDKYKESHRLYINEIYPNDSSLKNNGKFISEISVPIIYNMKIPYGYLQVNSSEPFTESSMPVIKKMAAIINELLRKNGIFPQAEEKLIVFDMSKNGLSVIFKNKQCIKYFNENQLVYFDLLLPENKKTNILATVKHITITGSVYKVGCSFMELDALSEIYYNEYLESTGINIQ